MNQFVFIIHCYKDFEDAHQLLKELVEFYPESKKTLIFDGTSNTDIEEFCFNNNITVIHGDRLYNTNSPEWIKRWMRHGESISNDNDCIVKLDAGVSIRGRLTRIPNTDVFGCLHAPKEGFKTTILQGGGVFIKNLAVQKLLKYKYLDNPIYWNAGFIKPSLTKRYGNGINPVFCETYITDHAIRAANLFVTDHPECFFCVKFPESFNPRRYKLIHPKQWDKIWITPKPFKVFSNDDSLLRACETLGFMTISNPKDYINASKDFDAVLGSLVINNLNILDTQHPASRFVFNTKTILQSDKDVVEYIKTYFNGREQDMIWYDQTHDDKNKLCKFLDERI